MRGTKAKRLRGIARGWATKPPKMISSKEHHGRALPWTHPGTLMHAPDTFRRIYQDLKRAV